MDKMSELNKTALLLNPISVSLTSNWDVFPSGKVELPHPDAMVMAMAVSRIETTFLVLLRCVFVPHSAYIREQRDTQLLHLHHID